LPKKLLIAVFLLAVCFSGTITDAKGARKPVPFNQFSIGDSIGEGQAAEGTIGEAYHFLVWSTGYDQNDGVYSINERFDFFCPKQYYENNADRDPIFNHAVSGATMDDFVSQASEIVSVLGPAPIQKAGMVTVLLGNNDVCADSLDAMTDPSVFEAQYRAGLDVLAASDATREAYIHVSSIMPIYWLWNALREDSYCRLIWHFVPCQNLLANPDNDCGSGNSHLDPDHIHPDDGPDCVRRKQVHAKIRDIYNPILRDVLQEYIDDGRLPNAYYIDAFDIQFGAEHINKGDCFHPSVAGHALLAEKQWDRSPWGVESPLCSPFPVMPLIYLLLLDDAK